MCGVYFAHSSRVRSTLPVSTTMISSAQRTDSKQSPICASSLRVMIVTDSLYAGRIIQPDRLIDEHHRDVVADLIQQPTGFTDQPVAILRQSNVAFTFGACQNG